jgi:ubiquinone/menaquinone biosynthesis C-methylase UbiE
MGASGREREMWDRTDRLRSLAGGFRAGQVIMTANRLGVFAAIGGGERAAGEVARSLGTDPRATKILLDALAGLDLLVKNGGSYRLSADAAEFLLPESPHTLCDALRLDARLYERWGKLEEAVRTGRPVKDVTKHRTEEEQRDFILAMANMGTRTARRLLDAVDLAGRRRLLDVGGGPGTFPAVFCRAYPELRGTVFDLPETIAIAREVLGREGMLDRIDLVEGDFLTDPLPAGHDAALVSNILHMFPEAACRDLIDKIATALEPGGMVILTEFHLEEDGAHPPSGSLFSVNMLLSTEGGRSYTVSQMIRWLESSGFSGAEFREIGSGRSVLTAEKRS